MYRGLCEITCTVDREVGQAAPLHLVCYSLCGLLRVGLSQ